MRKARVYWNRLALAVLVTSILSGCASRNIEPQEVSVPEPEEKVLGMEGSFGQFQFDLGQSDLKDATNRLDALSRVLHFHPGSVVQLSGHADATGGDVENLKLSEKRVDAVVEALESFGVSKDRIQTSYFGENRPVCPNDTEEGRACNRSVVVYIK